MGAGAVSDPDTRGRRGVTGVVAALPAEARWLRASALQVRIGGVGAEHARRAAQALLADGARSLISWGTAAALSPSLVLGTLVIADQVLADSDVLVPDAQWGTRVFDALRARAPAVPIVRGTVACPPRVLRDARAKMVLARQSGAIAADMESAAIGSVAREAGIPWLVLRVISDTADMVVPASVVGAIGADGMLSMSRLLAALIKRPGDVAAFPALAKGLRLAGNTMRLVAPVL